jgi:hypothetical protein
MERAARSHPTESDANRMLVAPQRGAIDQLHPAVMQKRLAFRAAASRRIWLWPTAATMRCQARNASSKRSSRSSTTNLQRIGARALVRPAMVARLEGTIVRHGGPCADAPKLGHVTCAPRKDRCRMGYFHPLAALVNHLPFAKAGRM